MALAKKRTPNLVVLGGHPFPAIEGAPPGTPYGPRGVVVPAVEHTAQAQLLPGRARPEQRVVPAGAEEI